MRCKKFKAGQPRGGRISASDLRPTEQRDNSTDLYASARAYYDATDFAVGPDVLLAEPLESGNRSSLSRSRRKSHECALAAVEFRLNGES